MKDQKAGVAIKKFVGLKSKMYLYFVDDYSNFKHKKAKGLKIFFAATTSINEYKVLLNFIEKEMFQVFDE